MSDTLTLEALIEKIEAASGGWSLWGSSGQYVAHVALNKRENNRRVEADSLLPALTAAATEAGLLL